MNAAIQVKSVWICSKDCCGADALDMSETLGELKIPGFNFHGLHGKPKRYSIHVNGPWCIIFEWQEGQALRVDLEQYH